MRHFSHFNPKSLEQAVALLQRYGTKARVIAGGTDLLGTMKDRILPEYPEALVNLKAIAGLESITVNNGIIRIGALARLEDVAHSPVIRELLPALAQAAVKAASPHLRAMGTLGGNLCQDVRCWYYRHPDNRFPCLRKGGEKCYAIEGDNRYHSIFGGSVEQGCYAVHPSDTAPALVVLQAEVKTTKRTLPVEGLFAVGVRTTTILDPDEILTQIRVPVPENGSASAFLKFALRKAIDFPIVNCAASLGGSNAKISAARICLNAVSVKPLRRVGAEEAIKGKPLTEENIEAAAEAAVASVRPMTRNKYMVPIARTLVKRTLGMVRDARPGAGRGGTA
jgi:xanthine dehydrogenase YagS FAD-binding subunit